MNAFELHAEAFARPARARPQRAPARTVEELREQREADAANELRRRAALWEREQLAEAGREDIRILELDKRLKRGLQEGQEDEVLRLAASFRGAPHAVRFIALKLIDSAIIRMRRRHGLPDFDDPLMGEPNNVFLAVKELLA
jgi:hypothetical protein